MTKPTVSKH